MFAHEPEEAKQLVGKLEAQERFWRGRMKEYEDRLEKERSENKISLEQLREEIKEERDKLSRQAKRTRILKKSNQKKIRNQCFSQVDQSNEDQEAIELEQINQTLRTELSQERKTENNLQEESKRKQVNYIVRFKGSDLIKLHFSRAYSFGS